VNKKYIILGSIKQKFNMQLYVRLDAKDINYLINKIIFYLWLCKNKSYLNIK